MSPGGDGTYDAIGLMRQLSEHTAAAVAEAHEVLASGSPRIGLEERKSDKKIFPKEKDQSMKVFDMPPKVTVLHYILGYKLS